MSNEGVKLHPDSWENWAFEQDVRANITGTTWPPRSYACAFCGREFRSAQALGGHMNVHRRDRAKLQYFQENTEASHLNDTPYNLTLRPSSISIDDIRLNGSRHLCNPPNGNPSHTPDVDEPTILVDPPSPTFCAPVSDSCSLSLKFAHRCQNFADASPEIVNFSMKASELYPNFPGVGMFTELSGDEILPDHSLLTARLNARGECEENARQELDLELRLGHKDK